MADLINKIIEIVDSSGIIPNAEVINDRVIKTTGINLQMAARQAGYTLGYVIDRLSPAEAEIMDNISSDEDAPLES